MDDLLLFTDSVTLLATTKVFLSSTFEMEDLGEAAFVLGIQVKRNRRDRILTISQSSYITTLLERHGMSQCKGGSTPLDYKAQLRKSDDFLQVSEKDTREYQSAVGSIMYAMCCTRPDLAHAITRLSQFSSKPSPAHREQ